MKDYGGIEKKTEKDTNEGEFMLNVRKRHQCDFDKSSTRAIFNEEKRIKTN